MRAAGEHNFQRNYNAQVALYGIDVQRSPSLVDNHIMGVIDVDMDVDGLTLGCLR